MAGGWLLQGPEDEEAMFARLTTQRRTLSTYSQDVALAQRTSDLARFAPWMAPGATLGLAKGGYDSGSPVAQAAAEASVKASEKKRGFLGFLGEVVTDAAKGASRLGTAALGAPYEAAQAQFRNIASGDPRRILGGAASIGMPGVGSGIATAIGGEEADVLGQTHLGVTAEQAVSGNVDTGSGFFTSGTAHQQQAERARASGSITYTAGPEAGMQHAITPGRWLTKFVAEPGSQPYRVMSGLTDASIAIADPSGKGLGRNRAFVQPVQKAPLPVRAAQRAVARVRPDRALETTGLVDGVRKTVLPQVADQWFTSLDGQKVIAAMADETDFQTLWTATRKQLPVDLTAKIADARTPEEVMDLLRPAIGVTVRDRPQVGGIGVAVQRRLQGVRSFQQMPSSMLGLDDLDDAVEQLDRFQRNARLPESVIAKNNAALARSGSSMDAYRVVVDDVLGAVDGALVRYGADPRDARRLTKAWTNYHADLTRYFVDEIGENAVVPGAVIDGFGKALPTPHLFAEYLHAGIPLPDARAIRTATSRIRRLYDIPGVTAGTALGDFLMSDVWKPMVLLRGAWTVRVVGEEQVRMGASGLNSMVAHPMSALAWVTGRKGALDIAGNPLEDAVEMGKSLSQRSGGWRDNVIRTKHKVLVRSDDEDFARSWADELAQLHSDPVGRRVSAGGLGPGDRVPSQFADEVILGEEMVFEDGALARQGALHLYSGREVRQSEVFDITKYGYHGEAPRLPGVPERLEAELADAAEELLGARLGRSITRGDEARPDSAGAVLRRSELDMEGVTPEVAAALGDAEVAERLRRFRQLEHEAAIASVTGALLDAGPRGRKAFLREDGGWRRLSEEDVAGLPYEAFTEGRIVLAFRAAAETAPQRQVREGIPGIKDWFFDGAGRKFRTEMAEASGRGDLLTREGADAYVDSVVSRVKVKTGDNPELLAAAASGRLGKHALSDGGRPAKGAVSRLDALAAEGVGPKVVKGDLLVATKKGGSDFAARYDRGVEVMFNTLMTRPTNYLSRSSAFKQFYWQRAEEMLPFMDDAAQTAAIANARKAGLKDVASRLEAQRAKGVAGTLTLADADLVAKGYGLDETRKLLYSLSERSQWADSLRLVFPFGEAWKEVLTRWVTIGAENPGAIQKARVGIEGARGQGFFSKNERGEEVFNYPMTGWLTQQAIGVNVPLQGRVAGLNLFSSSVIPGFGPVVTIPAGQLVPDRPEWDGVRKILMPFGEPDTSGGFAESFIPPWAQKLRIALGKGSPEQEKTFNNTVLDLARAMALTGEYPVNTPEQIDRLLTRARRNARVLYTIRSGAQFVAPSAPTPNVHVKDKDGRMIVADLLVKDYRRMQDELGYDAAVGAFLQTYGEAALLYMQPKTRGLADIPATKEAVDFVRRNPALAKKYPLVYGYFIPQDGEFDFEAYRQQIESGTREQVSPLQAVLLGNARVANFKYQQARKAAGENPGKAARDWLSSVRVALEKEYPGYGDYTGLTERATTEQRIEELAKASKDPKLADTEAGKAIATYLTARQRAQESAESLGLRGFDRAEKAEPIRVWLRTIGEALVTESPAFEAVWERLLANEVETTEDTA